MSNSLSVPVQTRINPPLGEVWQVLTDFGGYHTWHPILTLEPHAGPLAVGTLLQGQSSGRPAGEPARSRALKDITSSTESIRTR